MRLYGTPHAPEAVQAAYLGDMSAAYHCSHLFSPKGLANSALRAPRAQWEIRLRRYPGSNFMLPT